MRDSATPLQQEPSIGIEVGAVMRRFRREHGVRQRALAMSLGWGQATVSRAESDASALSVGRAVQLLRHTGHRLAIVPTDHRGSSSDLSS